MKYVTCYSPQKNESAEGRARTIKTAVMKINLEERSSREDIILILKQSYWCCRKADGYSSDFVMCKKISCHVGRGEFTNKEFDVN